MLTISRRTALVSGAAIAVAGRAEAAKVALNIMDVGGALALVQKPLENFRAAHPELVSRLTFSKAPAPELAGKLKAQQSAGRVDIDLVLGGVDALSAGMDGGLWMPLLPDHQAALPKPADIYLPAALKMHDLGKGQAMCMVYYPSGPLIEYLPEKVPNVPTTTDKLLSWCKQNPHQFMYARPTNSGPGRTWLMGLPYLLGDSNPKDPAHGWDKTWAYLKAIGETVEYYPSGTGDTMKALGEGSRSIIMSTTGWDINPRALGIVPKSAKVGYLKGFHWVADAQYMFIPKGVAAAKLPALFALMSWVLTPQQQAFTYDDGYFYPGPAVKDVPVSMAPAASQKVIAEYGRPEYAQWIADNPVEIPLDPAAVTIAFARWDQEIGGAKQH